MRPAPSVLSPGPIRPRSNPSLKPVGGPSLQGPLQPPQVTAAPQATPAASKLPPHFGGHWQPEPPLSGPQVLLSLLETGSSHGVCGTDPTPTRTRPDARQRGCRLGQLGSPDKGGNWHVLPLGRHPDSSNIITGFENLISPRGSRSVPLSVAAGKQALTSSQSALTPFPNGPGSCKHTWRPRRPLRSSSEQTLTPECFPGDGEGAAHLQGEGSVWRAGAPAPPSNPSRQAAQ